MAYDEGLAERIRSVVGDDRRITEKKMFGGVAFLLDGKMFVGIVKDDLMVRVGPERYEESLQDAHVRPETQLMKWVRLGTMFVATLPEKTKHPTKKRTGMKRPK